MYSTAMIEQQRCDGIKDSAQPKELIKTLSGCNGFQRDAEEEIKTMPKLWT